MKKDKIKFHWQTRKEKIELNLKISPKNKLIWLEEFNRFIYKALSDEEKKIRFDKRKSEI
ncbi:MAG: hypothetical protein APR54_07685 [Candidatus Cloacimonas sp. SDB]|nr:MAG: hypothetical protein APR54_07685 [Candidatus Cloacimonas sp. SDB]